LIVVDKLLFLYPQILMRLLEEGYDGSLFEALEFLTA
jgi:hypothetical protein